jgi:hypothetical protein
MTNSNAKPAQNALHQERRCAALFNNQAVLLRGDDATVGVEVIEPATTAMVEQARGFTQRLP